MSQAEFTELAGHLFEVVPTQGNGHVGFLRKCENYADLHEVVDDAGKTRYFRVKSKGRGCYIEVSAEIEAVSSAKTA